MTCRLNRDFYTRDVLTLAPALIGTRLICRDSGGQPQEYIITETEAYKGTDDLACHASKGRTKRNEIMFHQGGLLYIYLIYGIHWMLNIVSGEAEEPQAVLIRSLKGITGPGRLTKKLGIDKSFHNEDLTISTKIWLEEGSTTPLYMATPRIGIDYAGPQWKDKPWRFVVKDGDLP